jgi:hypothetical protein
VSKKSVMPSGAPKSEAEAKAIMADAAVVPMDGRAKEAPRPDVTVDEKKLSEQVRGSVKLVIREGTEKLRPTNAGDNPNVSAGGETLHKNQIQLVLNPFGKKGDK